MAGKHKKGWLTFLWIAINIGILAGIGMSGEIGWRNLAVSFMNLRFRFISAALVCMVLIVVIEGVVTNYLFRRNDVRIPFLKSCKYSLLSRYYNAITPFAGGGQPFIIYTMASSGVSAGCSSSIVASKYLFFQASLFVFSLVVFLSKLHMIAGLAKLYWVGAILGALWNFALPLSLFFFLHSDKLLRACAAKIIGFCSKLPYLRKQPDFKDKMMEQVKTYQASVRGMIRSPKAVLVVSLLSLLEVAMYFAIPYFVYRGLNLTGASWLDVAMPFLFLYLCSSFIPTPGASGASEGLFVLIYRVVIPGQFIYLAMLLWRSVTYYLVLLVGGGVVFISGMRSFRRKGADMIKPDGGIVQ